MTVAKRTDQEIWYRGYGEDQYVYYARKGPKEFLGGTFTVESYEDLEKYANIPISPPVTCITVTKSILEPRSCRQLQISRSWITPLVVAS